MHKPDFGKPLFTITIEVFENCQTMSTLSLIPDRDVTYQELMGTLESAKMRYMFDQSGINAEEYRKWKAVQDKKKTKQKEQP